MSWLILYRGSLSSCNYGCDYCPFAKTKNTRAELAKDAQELEQFVAWVKSRKEKIGILFTPWGEGLIRKYYQAAMTELSHLPNVTKVTIQTNLTCSTKWMEQVNKEKFALWTTFHPTQTSIEKFAHKCQELDHLNIKYSAGFVAFKEDISILEALRQAINPAVYVWANAYKRIPNYYTKEEIERIEQVDPLFRYNTQYHASLGESCRAGNTTFSVDGDGNMTRCHFIKESIGNIYESDLSQVLKPTPCTNATCGCHIGYVHLDKLNLAATYENSILERIPKEEFWRKTN